MQAVVLVHSPDEGADLGPAARAGTEEVSSFAVYEPFPCLGRRVCGRCVIYACYLPLLVLNVLDVPQLHPLVVDLGGAFSSSLLGPMSFPCMKSLANEV